MTEPILNENMEKDQTESNLSITNNDINVEVNKEFLEEIQMNAYHGWIDEDVVNHIAKVLEMVDLIYVPGVDSHQLRMKVFPLSLADDAKQWWINEGEGKITIWEELVENFFCKFYPDSYDREEEIDTEKEDEQSQTKRKYSNTSNSIDDQPNKRRCKAEKFEAIQYSLGPNEEYIAIRGYEFDIWERNEDNLSIIYQDIFSEKERRMEDMPEDIKVPLILIRSFLSTARAKIDVYKRKITLRVGEERIVFISVKPTSSLTKRVYMLSLRERMELDLEARLMGETLALNRSLDPFLGRLH
ncbi:hypothetical protein Tco_0530933 [Tanacetum coccineum]